MDTSLALTAEQRAGFDADGHLVLPGLLTDDEIAALKADVDELAASKGRHAYELGAIGALTWHPRTLDIVEDLMATWRPRGQWAAPGSLPDFTAEASGSGRCVSHHVHAARHDPGTGGVPWHQDY